MLVHPGILALLCGALLTVVILAAAALLGMGILRRWDRNSTTEVQLRLERRTYLISSLVSYAFTFEIASLLLFVYTADELHDLFAGAMCATGVLNANPTGWWVLYLKIASFFLCGVWLMVNAYDQRSDELPLIRLKYGALLLLLPFFLLEAVLLVRYFTGLSPSIITSCCGALFSSSKTTMAGSLSGLPMVPAMTVFYGMALAYVIALLFCLRGGAAGSCVAAGAVAVLFFLVALAAVISFISVYIYEMPTHHCPFDILQAEYGYVGYPLYASLFGSVLCGIMAAVAALLARKTSLARVVAGESKVWSRRALLLLAIFLAVASWPLVSGSFSMRSYL